MGYLLTGDSGLFEHVLTTHFRSQIDMQQLGGPTTLGWFRVQLVPDQARIAEQLARSLYQKVVPLPQRLRLDPLSGAERLALVKDALLSMVKRPGSDETLADYLTADELKK